MQYIIASVKLGRDSERSWWAVYFRTLYFRAVLIACRDALPAASLPHISALCAPSRNSKLTSPTPLWPLSTRPRPTDKAQHLFLPPELPKAGMMWGSRPGSRLHPTLRAWLTRSKNSYRNTKLLCCPPSLQGSDAAFSRTTLAPSTHCYSPLSSELSSTRGARSLFLKHANGTARWTKWLSSRNCRRR